MHNIKNKLGLSVLKDLENLGTNVTNSSYAFWISLYR